jgi:hypothetical protein
VANRHPEEPNRVQPAQLLTTICIVCTTISRRSHDELP